MAKRGLKCKDCGRPIRFVRLKDGRCIVCEAKMIFVNPDANCSDTYYRANGTKVQGLRDPNGTGVFAPHRCPKPINKEELRLGW